MASSMPVTVPDMMHRSSRLDSDTDGRHASASRAGSNSAPANANAPANDSANASASASGSSRRERDRDRDRHKDRDRDRDRDRERDRERDRDRDRDRDRERDRERGRERDRDKDREGSRSRKDKNNEVSKRDRRSSRSRYNAADSDSDVDVEKAASSAKRSKARKRSILSRYPTSTLLPIFVVVTLMTLIFIVIRTRTATQLMQQQQQKQQPPSDNTNININTHPYHITSASASAHRTDQQDAQSDATSTSKSTAELSALRTKNAELQQTVADLTSKLEACKQSCQHQTSIQSADDGGNPNPVINTDGASVAAISTPAAAAAAAAGAALSALITDRTSSSPIIDLKSHEKEWLYCQYLSRRHRSVLEFCPSTPNSEQNYQLSFYDQFDSKGGLVPMYKRPTSPSCIQLPPNNYRWPNRITEMPAPSGTSGTYWNNLRVNTLEDLKVFNPSAYKNLYHFDAPRYDEEWEMNILFGEKYIPLATKVRLALDVGSGGGSFGLWLKYKYDIQSLSIAFPDWPYCEYISERGNLCMYLDAFHAFPFAKFTFDLVHVAWVYHSMDIPELEVSFRELYRITRPGGYLWLSDGWSQAQVDMMDQLIDILGLVVLYDHRVPHKKETYFGKHPYEVQWWSILLKPIRASQSPSCNRALYAKSLVKPVNETKTITVHSNGPHPPDERQ